ncbi:MAG: Bifunctional N-acetylglucosamine-1-phosphate uridyltransferase/glucosamine-1-phosphate acetyltransferase [uncultured Campylobacterales bacterium]|uniref:Bifunctional N-acetylglucosamine-1-phosphate uridyltransferase/glucosamine-1-phosphate acetyltransferase n=1 Tax=uncultured Campylobacterales bacterium TaxID=352960 RepID=A0A6S6TGU4_9BACT|nr:MAG: Bifunctional N-acetylglucosamine-1-phosphate uridyltransferase/glucosamine-1-phosphate acetyltransferase [uncultured Campylobacterales bacterium]
MHIIVPMSGIGKRFIDAGYKDPKPLIMVDEKPIIEHVCELFPGEDKFTFICNSKHLATTNMREVLLKIKPNANIVEIPNHKKGPVYAVSLMKNFISDDEEVIVNYCDFGTYWDYEDFLAHTRGRNADGAIPAYKGFHPHMLGTTNYAFMRDDKQWMLEIKEKEPFTNNRMNEYASNGTYYFKKGSYLKKYFDDLIKKDIDLNGEYYVSLVYNLLAEDGLKVSIYDVEHMLQWGTPQDVEEYKTWSKYFRNVCEDLSKLKPKESSVTLIPLAGRGSRFANEGYSDPKPLIEVSAKPMIVQAANSLPNSKEHIFVTLNEHLDNYPLENTLKTEYPNSNIICIDEVTSGQAITCSLGLKDVDEEKSLLIAATDNGMLYDKQKYEKLILDDNVDAVVFTFKNHISSKKNPEMYGWVKVDNEDNVNAVSVKVPISDNPYDDNAIVGTFYFKKVKYFNEALNSLLQNNIRVNGEYYVDSMMAELLKLGYNVKAFEVDDYICWGTPNDYETFVYWQSFFHKCDWHPYSLEKDKSVNQSKISELDKKYRSFEQEYK